MRVKCRTASVAKNLIFSRFAGTSEGGAVGGSLYSPQTKNVNQARDAVLLPSVPYEVWDWDETLAPPWDPLRKESFLIETVCDWSCPSVDSWPIFKCSPFLFRNKTTEICVSHCREIVWKSHPYYSHMGPFWANKGSSRICIQYWAPKTLVSCPTRWFLLSTFGYLWWSSSWWWQPYIAGCKLFWPLLRAGMTNSDHFFCKMYL